MHVTYYVLFNYTHLARICKHILCHIIYQNYLPIDCRDPPVNLEFNPLQHGLLVKPNFFRDKATP